MRLLSTARCLLVTLALSAGSALASEPAYEIAQVVEMEGKIRLVIGQCEQDIGDPDGLLSKSAAFVRFVSLTAVVPLDDLEGQIGAYLATLQERAKTKPLNCAEVAPKIEAFVIARDADLPR